MKFEYYDLKLANISYDGNSKLNKNIEKYAQILNLLYLMSFFRPNIMFAIGRLSKYT